MSVTFVNVASYKFSLAKSLYDIKASPTLMPPEYVLFYGHTFWQDDISF